MPDPLHILALNWPTDQWPAVTDALAAKFDRRATWASRADLTLVPADVLRTDLVLVRVPTGADSQQKFIRRLAEWVDEYPYLPIVVVGRVEKYAPAFAAVKAARYLPADASPGIVAREAALAIGAAWWNGVQAFDDPILVIDRRGIVMRANPVARRRFGMAIVGRPYLEAVEERAGARWKDLPEHPITAAFHFPPAEPTGRLDRRGWPAPAGHSRYWHTKDGQQPARAQLVCIPVLGLRNAVRAVCVLFIDLTLWAQIAHAVVGLAEAKDLDDLFDRIAGAVHHPTAGLGYERVRLYTLEADGAGLKGQASRGFNPNWDAAPNPKGFAATHAGRTRAEYFRETFRLPVADDQASDWLVTYRLPTLCLSRPEPPADRRPDAQLVQEFFRRAFDDETDGPVERWIDVPLVAPGTGRLIGKLSVDRLQRRDDGTADDRSGTLGAQDVAALAVFAVAAAAAVAAQERRDAEVAGLRFFERVGPEMAAALERKPDPPPGPRPIRPSERVPPGVRALLRLFRELTDADVVYYRGYHRVRLSVEKDEAGRLEVWRDNQRPDGLAVPEHILAGDGYSDGLLQHVGPDASWSRTDPPAPVAVVIDPAHVPARQTWFRGRGWSEAERALLDCRHELYLPVVVGGKLQGALVAVSRTPLPTPESPDWWRVRLFMDTARLWFELGVRRVEQDWWQPTLTQLLAAVDVITPAFGDRPAGLGRHLGQHPRAYAGLVTTLTAFAGIGWNRCLWFEVNETGEAVLVYAVGGGGSAAHETVQQDNDLLQPLADLVRPLLADPVPRPPAGRRPDVLYHVCVGDHRLDPPVAFRAADATALSQLLVPSWADDCGYMLVPTDEPWCRAQDDRFAARATAVAEPDAEHHPPRLFAAANTYAFPVWRPHPQAAGGRRLWAIILLDMAYRPHESVVARLSATRLYLNILADAVSSWEWQQAGNMSVLLEYVHRHHGLREQVVALNEAAGRAAVAADQETLKGLADSLGRLVSLLDTDWARRAGQPVFTPLRPLLADICDLWHQDGRVAITLTWDPSVPDDPVVPGPDFVFRLAVEQLLRNAIAFIRPGESHARVDVRIRQHPCPRGTRAVCLCILVRDHGTGIDPSHVPLVFSPGFTTRADGGDHGMGLAQVRAGLARHGGDLRLTRPGWQQDDHEGGAVFEITYYVQPLAGTDGPLKPADKSLPPDAAKG